jgi:hypothetical protein
VTDYWLLIAVFLGPQISDITFSRPTTHWPTAESCYSAPLQAPPGTVSMQMACVHRTENKPVSH